MHTDLPFLNSLVTATIILSFYLEKKTLLHFNSWSGSRFISSPSYRVQFWCDPPVSAAAGRSWRLVHWWCCHRSRPGALAGRPPVPYPGSSHLLGHGTPRYPTASESNERQIEGDMINTENVFSTRTVPKCHFCTFKLSIEVFEWCCNCLIADRFGENKHYFE